jgi:hypothetical protein
MEMQVFEDLVLKIFFVSNTLQQKLFLKQKNLMHKTCIHGILTFSSQLNTYLMDLTVSAVGDFVMFMSSPAISGVCLISACTGV